MMWVGATVFCDLSGQALARERTRGWGDSSEAKLPSALPLITPTTQLAGKEPWQADVCPLQCTGPAGEWKSGGRRVQRRQHTGIPGAPIHLLPGCAFRKGWRKSVFGASESHSCSHRHPSGGLPGVTVPSPPMSSHTRPQGLGKAGLEAFHPLCLVSLPSGPPLCLAAGIGSTGGGGGLAAHSCLPATCPGAVLPTCLLFFPPSWIYPFLSMPCFYYLPAPPWTSCPSLPLPVLLGSVHRKSQVFLQKLQCLDSPHLPRVVRASWLAESQGKELKIQRVWGGLGEALLPRCSTRGRVGEALRTRKQQLF